MSNSKNKIKKGSSKNIKIAKTPKSKGVKGVVWDLEPILAGKNFDEWMKKIDSKIEAFKRYRGILSENLPVSKLLEMIRLEEDIAMSAGRIEIYYSLKFYADTKNQEALSKMGTLKQVSAKIGNDIMFFSLWFMKIDEKAARRFMESKELRPYRYNLELIRKDRPYTKTEDVEKMLNIKDITGGSAFAEIYDIITNNYMFEWSGKKVSKEEVINYYRSENPKLREKSYDLMLFRYKDDSTALSEIYKNVVTDWYNDGVTIRGHISSINIRNMSQDISDKSVDALLKAVRKNAGIFTEYFRIKYDLNRKLGQRYPYSRYHLYAPFITKSEKKYGYEESKVLVLDTFKRFDPRFSDRALKIFNENHVHSHPMPSKRGGAFCHSVTCDITPYILLNHTDSIKDVFTMIHELGHGVHDLFSGENQADLEKHAALTICETASIFSEMLLADRMLRESKDAEEKKYVLTQLLDNQWATIIRQAYFVIFELYAHEQIIKGVSKDVLDEEYFRLLKEQFGDMHVPEIFRHEWNYIPHIHETPFYCYSYAWGNLFVLALFDMYKKDGKKFIDKYVELLSAGGSDSPTSLMKKLGVNPESEEFWQRGFDIVKQEIEELKRIAK